MDLSYISQCYFAVDSLTENVEMESQVAERDIYQETNTGEGIEEFGKEDTG